MNNIVLNNGIYDISVKEYPGDGSHGFVLACHGFASSFSIRHFERIAEELGKNGTAFAVFALPGHEGSPVGGEFLYGEATQQDIDTVMEYMLDKWGEPAGLLGLSYGADMMWKASGRYPGVKKLLCMNTAVKRTKVIDRFLGKRIPEIREKGYVYIGRKNPIKITEKYLEYLENCDIYGEKRDNVPETLFIHGNLDTLAPVEDIKVFAARTGFPLIVLEGEDHVFSPEGEDISAVLAADFFRKEE